MSDNPIEWNGQDVDPASLGTPLDWSDDDIAALVGIDGDGNIADWVIADALRDAAQNHPLLFSLMNADRDDGTE